MRSKPLNVRNRTEQSGHTGCAYNPPANVERLNKNAKARRRTCSQYQLPLSTRIPNQHLEAGLYVYIERTRIEMSMCKSKSEYERRSQMSKNA